MSKINWILSKLKVLMLEMTLKAQKYLNPACSASILTDLAIFMFPCTPSWNYRQHNGLMEDQRNSQAKEVVNTEDKDGFWNHVIVSMRWFQV